jgi:hypothetical protein
MNHLIFSRTGGCGLLTDISQGLDTSDIIRRISTHEMVEEQEFHPTANFSLKLIGGRLLMAMFKARVIKRGEGEKARSLIESIKVGVISSQNFGKRRRTADDASNESSHCHHRR